MRSTPRLSITFLYVKWGRLKILPAFFCCCSCPATVLLSLPACRPGSVSLPCSCVSLLMDEALAVSTPSLQLSPALSGRAMAFWDNWQGSGRERFFYHTELLADMAVHLLTLLHHVHVWLLHGMSFHLLDALLLLDTRVVVVSFVQRVKAHLMHRCGELGGVGDLLSL